MIPRSHSNPQKNRPYAFCALALGALIALFKLAWQHNFVSTVIHEAIFKSF